MRRMTSGPRTRRSPAPAIRRRRVRRSAARGTIPTARRLATVTLWAPLAAAVAPADTARAQEPERRVSMEEALALFGEHSLSLRIARSDALTVAGEARQFRAYFNPALGVVHENLGLEGEDYWETTIGVEQRIEWPGRTAARGRAADHRIGAADARVRSDSLRLAFEVRRAYSEAWAAEGRAVSQRRSAEVIARVADAAERRFEEGDISGYELRRLRLERVRSEQDLAAAELRGSAARRELATLILPDSDVEEVGPAEPLVGAPPAISLASALEALSIRSDIEAAERALEAARAGLAVASSGWVPDPTLQLGYKDQADGFSGAVLGLSLPMPLFDRNGGAAEAARGRRDAASAALALRRREARNDVVAAHARHASTLALLGRGAGVLEDAEALLETAETAYAEGELSLVELIDAARAYRDAGTTAVALRADAWIAYYDVLRAMGRAPEEHR